MFHLKGAHLCVQRVGRDLLRPFGLTPARFDLMNALGLKGIKQSDLWRRLGVVRSVVCETLRSLRELGWVKRVRAADGRTWLVQLTQRGRAVFERAYADCVENGEATLQMEVGLSVGSVELRTIEERPEFIARCSGFEDMFRTTPWFRGPDLYPWDPEDYYFMLTSADDRTGGEEVPWLDEVLDQMSVISVVST